MFSYCLTSFFDTNSTSPLLLGPLAKFSGTTIKSTPFVKNPSRVPMNTYYYLSLQGISLGTNNLAIPPAAFALQSNGTGGFIIDSGTTFTILVNEAYLAVKSAIKSIVKLPIADGSTIGFDLCYFVRSSSSPPSMPNLIFHFDSADMVLPVDNYMVFGNQNLWCLALFSSDISLSILGNFQQQNFHILYDVDKEVLSFAPANCATI
ncbi:Eukaryotic aspartyl protease family protein [Rhynchospora pubera]|uniref:Eukaryotic aspartyl protease family protein n=1 Tax=Rhynchospora pubera TaxID=906938 RepID=A0AAV8G7N2_9POAL|nr:Eukaryotic aspartyl protease family protein [Rhynchospora pubera]